MPSDLPTQLLELRRHILAMGSLVENRVQRVIEALISGDLTEAHEIRHGDREVDVMENDIEAMCMEVLALMQPVAGDLRFILAVLRINGELERTGDLAKGIAKRVIHLEKIGVTAFPDDIREMARSVKRMLSNALSSLSNNDADLARQVRRDDSEIDTFQRQVFTWAQQVIAEHGVSTEATIDCMNIARGLERIGDLCTNIAEDVIFHVEGQVVRHTRL